MIQCSALKIHAVLLISLIRITVATRVAALLPLRGATDLTFKVRLKAKDLISEAKTKKIKFKAHVLQIYVYI